MSVGYRFGNLIIRKDVYYPAERRRYWYVSCEVCNRDKELFPSLFRTNKQQIEAGSLPCGCAKQVKWNTLQYQTLIQRECEGSGLQVYKLPEKIISSSKITLKSSSGLFWKVTVKNFLKGVRPKWFKQASKTKLDKLITKYSNEDVTITVDQEGLIYERCHRCEIDKFSSLGLRSDFKTNTANLRNKVKMCRCSNKHHKLLYEWEILLSKKIQNLGGKFLAIEDFEKYKTNAWVYYLCRKGNLSKSRLYNLWWGDRWCRCCTLSGTGHYLYITLWKLSGKVVWGKYGITSKLPSQRANRQKKKASISINYEIYKSWYLPDYKTAKVLEDEIKSWKLPTVPERSVFPDGYTETFAATSHNLEMINNLLEDFQNPIDKGDQE